MAGRPLTICLAVVLAGPAWAQGGSTPPQVTTIDGDDFQGKLVSIDSDQAVFVVRAKRRPVPLRDLLALRFAPAEDLMARAGQKVLVLAGGGRLAAQRLVVRDGEIRLDTALLGRVKVKLSVAAVMYLPGPEEPPATLAKRFREIRPKRGPDDYLIALNEKGIWVPVSGALKGADDEKVRFRFGDEERTVKLSAVRVIQLARVPHESLPAIGRLVGVDGSVLPFSAIRFDGSKLEVTGEGVGEADVDLADVAEIQFDSDRSVYLSDLEAAKVFQAGMFDVVFPFQKDRSAAGKPIRLDGKTYPRGLGLHSRCALTFNIEGRFERFVAVVGIDEAGGKRGNATLKLLGDDKELIRPLKLTGGAAAKLARCSVAGVKTFKIVVDFGDDGTDVGDHVALAGARLIKP